MLHVFQKYKATIGCQLTKQNARFSSEIQYILLVHQMLFYFSTGLPVYLFMLVLFFWYFFRSVPTKAFRIMYHLNLRHVHIWLWFLIVVFTIFVFNGGHNILMYSGCVNAAIHPSSMTLLRACFLLSRWLFIGLLRMMQQTLQTEFLHFILLCLPSTR